MVKWIEQSLGWQGPYSRLDKAVCALSSAGPRQIALEPPRSASDWPTWWRVIWRGEAVGGLFLERLTPKSLLGRGVDSAGLTFSPLAGLGAPGQREVRSLLDRVLSTPNGPLLLPGHDGHRIEASRWGGTAGWLIRTSRGPER